MSGSDVLLKPDECALLPVDFQAGLAFGVESTARQTLLNNAVALARTAIAFQVPVVASTSASRVYSGPMIPALQEAVPSITPIERRNMNVWEDDAARAALLHRLHGSRSSAGWLRGGVDGALQLGNQFRNGPIQLAGDAADRSVVARLQGRHSDGLKQHRGGHVVGVGDKRNRHPAADRLVSGVDLPHAPRGPRGEDDHASHRQHECQPHRHRAPPGFSHNSI